MTSRFKTNIPPDSESSSQRNGTACFILALGAVGDLSENQIQAVPRKAFRGITAVKNLQLDSNHISCIEDGAFRALRDLEILTLNNNNITLIPLSSFNHMPKLRTLRLHSNRPALRLPPVLALRLARGGEGWPLSHSAWPRPI
ncbi:hypothetical protein cypCar_00006355 [Cyprinus carpio]|nr:hypothetical protein cypCar_00006355 [Cyprinus carpio]